MTRFKLSIPEPCSEDWSKMTPTEQGAFCDHCSTEVLDLSNMTAFEIGQVIKENPKGFCSRMNANQLNSTFQSPAETQSTPPALIAASLAVLASLAACTTDGGETAHRTLGEVVPTEMVSETDSVEIKVVVTNMETHERIPNPKILIDSTYLNNGNFNGELKIKLHQAPFYSLHVEAFGYADFDQYVQPNSLGELHVIMQAIELIPEGTNIYIEDSNGVIIQVESHVNKPQFLTGFTVPSTSEPEPPAELIKK